MMYRSIIIAIALAIAAPALAEEFSIVTSRDAFVALVKGREINRFGIRLTVTPEGQIAGRAFGGKVTGAWDWNGGYFCRDLFYAGNDLGFNCQLVQVDGDRIRFTSDRGTGMYADMRLR